MKASELFKTIKYTALIILTTWMVSSCENKPAEEKEADPAKQAAEENDIKFENKKLEKDAQFLVDATAFNLEQVQLGRLGEKKGNADVKHLSQMMMEEHSKALNKLTEFSKSKQISIPDSISTEAQDNYNELKEKSGNEFDKAFFDRMVESHQKAVGFFEKESADSRDQDLKEYATITLPEIRKHLDHIFAAQKKLEPK